MELNVPIKWDLAKNLLFTGIAKEVKYFGMYYSNSFILKDGKIFECYNHAFREPTETNRLSKVIK